MQLIIVFALGFLTGWLVFKRPQWATDLLNKAWAKIGPKVAS